MGKFIVHGIVVEEPRKVQLKSGNDCLYLLIESKTQTSYKKEFVNLFEIGFMGNSINCIPEIRLTGSLVVVQGTIKGRVYNGRYYYDLVGDGLTIINSNTFANTSNLPSDKVVGDDYDLPVVNTNTEDEETSIDIEDDDLPF